MERFLILPEPSGLAQRFAPFFEVRPVPALRAWDSFSHFSQIALGSGFSLVKRVVTRPWESTS
jgi:hypothetical protein